MNKKSILLIMILVVLSLTITLPSLLLITYQLSAAKCLKRFVNPVLAGVIINQDFPAFTKGSFTNGSFQKHFAKWFQENHGGRGQLIKLNSQIYYSLFNKSYQYSGDIIIGKERFLYEKDYIEDYVNITPKMKREDQKMLVAKVRSARDLFEKNGIKFIILITPSKAYTYPEYIPDEFIKLKKGPTTYDEIIPLIISEKFNILDYQKIIFNIKKTSSLPVFPPGGTHWTYLIAYYAAVDLISMIEKITSAKLPELKMKSIVIKNRPVNWDADLLDLMNLAIPFDYISPVPDLPVFNAGRGSAMKVSIIGGSFTQQLYDYFTTNWIFGTVYRFYYYTLGLNTFPAETKMEQEFFARDKRWWKDYILKSDVVILEINQDAFSAQHIQDFLDDGIKYMKE